MNHESAKPLFTYSLYSDILQLSPFCGSVTAKNKNKKITIINKALKTYICSISLEELE